MNFLEKLPPALKGRRGRVTCMLIAVGFLLIIFSGLFSGGAGSDPSDGDSEIGLSEYGAELEARLAEMCSSIEGVGKCKVIVTFSCGGKSTYKGGILIESSPPEVMGVTVICRGGGSESVKRDVTEMISSLFGIGSNRVAVLKLNS